MQRLLWRWFVGMHVGIYRLTKGRLGSEMGGGRVLLLTTRGRKTGKVRTTPLGYFRDGDNYVVVASNGGLPNHPAWYLNLRHTPQVTIQVKEAQMPAVAETAGPEKRSEMWQMITRVAPAYQTYQMRVAREIPVVILRPTL